MTQLTVDSPAKISLHAHARQLFIKRAAQRALLWINILFLLDLLLITGKHPILVILCTIQIIRVGKKSIQEALAPIDICRGVVLEKRTSQYDSPQIISPTNEDIAYHLLIRVEASRRILKSGETAETPPLSTGVRSFPTTSSLYNEIHKNDLVDLIYNEKENRTLAHSAEVI